MTAARVRRALARARDMSARITALEARLADASLDDAARTDALLALESLVLVSRGSAEEDHRKQLFLGGLQAAADAYLVAGAPHAAAYAASEDQDALLAAAALHELRDEYGDEAAAWSEADVARAVREWAAGPVA